MRGAGEATDTPLLTECICKLSSCTDLGFRQGVTLLGSYTIKAGTHCPFSRQAASLPRSLSPHEFFSRGQETVRPAPFHEMPSSNPHQAVRWRHLPLR